MVAWVLSPKGETVTKVESTVNKEKERGFTALTDALTVDTISFTFSQLLLLLRVVEMTITYKIKNKNKQKNR